MNCTLPAITLTGLAMSDLFFNYEHPEWDALFRAEAETNGLVAGPTAADFDAALLKDATEFAAVVTGSTDTGTLPQDLVADFKARL